MIWTITNLPYNKATSIAIEINLIYFKTQTSVFITKKKGNSLLYQLFIKKANLTSRYIKGALNLFNLSLKFVLSILAYLSLNKKTCVLPAKIIELRI